MRTPAARISNVAAAAAFSALVATTACKSSQDLSLSSSACVNDDPSLGGAAFGPENPNCTPPAALHMTPAPKSDAPPPSLLMPPAELARTDLAHLTTTDDEVTAPLPDKRTAHLTLSPTLQKTARDLLAMNHLPEGAIVLFDTRTGEAIVYASHLEHGALRDLAVEATAPAASVFKLVTSTALIEHAGLNPDTKQCYSGGEQRIEPVNLEDDANRDRWCATLAGALGRSLNTVFARLALHHLKKEDLASTAHDYGFGAPVPFDVPVQPSTLEIPDDSLGYARTAAGFWNSTLSPMQAAWISSTVARGGDSVRPTIVRQVTDANGAVVWKAGEPKVVHRVSSEAVAAQVSTMMEHTVNEGTSYRAFHDNHGEAFLHEVQVAGKTGTLTDAEKQRFYTWFTGFAPVKPMPGVAQVAIAVLVVNGPSWKIKANGIARDMLRAYFAEQDVQGVTKPRIVDDMQTRGRTRARSIASRK